MNTLRWMRVPGDMMFAAGAAVFAWFVLGLLTGHSFKDRIESARSQRQTAKPQELTAAGR